MPVWETLDRRYLWQSRWYNLRQDRLRTAAGHEFTYTMIEHPGAVWVVPVTGDGRFYTSNGISSEIVYVHLATGVELGEPYREPTEELEVRLVPVAEAMRMAREGEISDGPSALALLWCESLTAMDLAAI